MRALGRLLCGLVLLGALAACGGAGSPPVQVGPTAAPTEMAPAASPAGTMDPSGQDDYEYDY